MKNKKDDINKLKALSKKEEEVMTATLTSWRELINRYNSEEKRKDALKDVQYLKFCAALVNYHYFLRTALQELKKASKDSFKDLFCVYVLTQSFALPSLPNLEQFFKDLATLNEEKEYDVLKEEEKKNESLQN